MTILYYLFLFTLSIMPVAGLFILIYFMDKYEKEPVKKLIVAFFGGFLAAVFDVILVKLIFNNTIGRIPGFSETAFYENFFGAGIPEELCKFAVFMIFIWRDKNFNEYFDGIIYASLIGLGFACLENVLYVLQGDVFTGIKRATLSVPGHFFYGVILGYFLSLAKFDPKKRIRHIITGLLIIIVVHGIWDYVCDLYALFIKGKNETTVVIAYICLYLILIFITILLWIFGMKLIRKHQKRSLAQAQAQSDVPNETPVIAQAQSGDTDNKPLKN